jgi:hypothetical protein
VIDVDQSPRGEKLCRIPVWIWQNRHRNGGIEPNPSPALNKNKNSLAESAPENANFRTGNHP